MQANFSLELLLPQIVLGKAVNTCFLSINADPSATLEGRCAPSWGESSPRPPFL